MTEPVRHALALVKSCDLSVNLTNCGRLLVDFQPMQRKYSRLKLNGTVISKRDLRALIETKTVRDWDDPRLYTLKAMRRRGIPPGALLLFLQKLGVTTATTSIDMKCFEQSVRQYLEMTARA